MIGKSFLARMSRNISIGMEENPSAFSDHSFGGLNVIMFGDLHQFPPVAAKRGEPLYRAIDSTQDDMDSQIGRRIYEEFTKVVVLRKQNRVTDPVWKQLLTRLRMGEITDEDVGTVKKLVMTPQSVKADKLLDKDWSDACLVTPRHSVRQHWNNAALRQWCAHTGRQIFVCRAEDSISGKKNSPTGRILSKGGEYTNRQGRTAPATIEMAVGMKVMVTENLDTDLDITNGARGEIIAIVLHPDEPPSTQDSVVHLRHLPVYILVKLIKTRASQLPLLDQGVIPIEPHISSTKFAVEDEDGKVVQRSGKRRQYCLTAAYAFTDYRAQGQTISHVIVDIARPPRGTLSLFNVYVALSRSSGRSTIRLLRDFDEGVLRQSHQLDLLAEDDRLNRLHDTTQRIWSQGR